MDDKYYRYEEDVNLNCHRNNNPFYDDLIYASLVNDGILDESCTGFDLSGFPGYNKTGSFSEDPAKDTREKGTPKAIEKCADGKGFKRYLKGHTDAYFTNGNLTTLKEVLTRYGPVKADVIRVFTNANLPKRDYPDGKLERGDDEYIIIGWTATGLLILEEDYVLNTDKTAVVSRGLKVGSVLFKGKGSYYYNDEDGYNQYVSDADYDLTVHGGSFYGSSVAALRVALSVILAAVVLPALSLF